MQKNENQSDIILVPYIFATALIMLNESYLVDTIYSSSVVLFHMACHSNQNLVFFFSSFVIIVEFHFIEWEHELNGLDITHGDISRINHLFRYFNKTRSKNLN